MPLPQETPFCLFPELNHSRNLAGKAAIARRAERTEQSWGHSSGAERGLWGTPHTGGETWWSCSLRCGQECCKEAEEHIMDFSKTQEPPLDLHPPQLQRYLDIEWSLNPTDVNRDALTYGERGLLVQGLMQQWEKECLASLWSCPSLPRCTCNVCQGPWLVLGPTAQKEVSWARSGNQ